MPAGPRKQQTVLALLALSAGRAVGMDDLIDELWPERPPPSAVANVRGYAGRLRRTFAAIEPGVERLIRRGSGYLLRLEPDELDLSTFAAEVADGRDALRRGEHKRAAARFADGLGLWRGAVVAGLPRGPLLAARCAVLDDERLTVTEELAEAYLALEEPAEAVALLRDHARAYPTRERAHLLLMRGLHRTGDVVGALAVYAAARTALVEQLGIEPGADLRELHRAILNRGEVAETPAPDAIVTSTSRPASTVPAQLPPDVFAFTGRRSELDRLDELLAAADEHQTAVVISAIAGTAGVGKTAIAVHWAHRVRDQFPDGQLYINLRGFDPTGSPVSPAEAVRGFLDAFEVAPQRIPASLPAQIGLYRSLVADRRVLVVLDNARDPDQVRPLLPGSSGCLALVTSRNQLTGLIAADGAQALQLDLLTVDEARDLFTRRVGVNRATEEPDAVEEIIGRCAGLPLALAIAAARAATNSRLSLGALAVDLRGATDRLDALTTGDASTDVRAVFSWSYHQLSLDAARLFRLLGLHPGPDIGPPAAASLTGIPVAQVKPLLAALTRAHLISEPTPNRYTLHDLLRAYATELSHTTDRAADRQAAVGRVLEHYLHTAHTASRLLNPHRDSITRIPPRPGVSPEHPTDHQQAIVWFTAEHPVLLTAVDHAARAGLDIYAWQLAWTLWIYLDRRGRWHDIIATWHTAVAAARRLGDPSMQARAHRLLGRAYLRIDRFDDAHAHVRHALDLYDQAGDQLGQAQTHQSRAIMWERQSRYADALHDAERALDLFQATGHRRGQALSFNSIGWYHAHLENHEQAVTYCQRALSLLQDLGDRHGQAAAWDSLGYAHHHIGDHTFAITCYQHALDLIRDLGDRYDAADTLTHLGDTYQAAGHLQAARDAWQQAFAILNDLDHPYADELGTKLRHLDYPNMRGT